MVGTVSHAALPPLAALLPLTMTAGCVALGGATVYDSATGALYAVTTCSGGGCANILSCPEGQVDARGSTVEPPEWADLRVVDTFAGETDGAPVWRVTQERMSRRDYYGGPFFEGALFYECETPAGGVN